MRVLLVRLGALGDIVHAIPAALAVAAAAPGAEIDWLVDRRHRAVLDLFDLPVRPIEIGSASRGGGALRAAAYRRGGGALAPREMSELWRTIGALRRRAYDAAVDLQGLIKSAMFARLSGARRVIGFARHVLREPLAGLLYTEAVDPGVYGHVIQKNVALASAIGDGARSPTRIVMPLKPAAPTRERVDSVCGHQSRRGLAEQTLGSRSLRRPGRSDSPRPRACRHRHLGTWRRAVGAGGGRGFVRRRAAGAGDRPARVAGACAWGAARGLGRHRTAPSRRRGGHAGGRRLRPHRPATKRAVGERRHLGLGVSPLHVPSQAAVLAGDALPRRHRCRRRGPGRSRAAGGRTSGEAMSDAAHRISRAPPRVARVRLRRGGALLLAANLGIAGRRHGDRRRRRSDSCLGGRTSREGPRGDDLGPYRFIRHPLYLGSSIMGIGVGIASRSLVASLVLIVYMGATIAAAIRTEEAFLRRQFGDAYDAYAASRGPHAARRFSVARAWRNREYRAVAGFAVFVLLLIGRMWLRETGVI